MESRNTARNGARYLVIALMWLFLAAVVVQFYFAGRGLLSGGGMVLHQRFGWSIAHIPIILALLAPLVGLGWRTTVLTVVLAVVSGVQPYWVVLFRGQSLGALHIPLALAVAVLSYVVAMQATSTLRAAPDSDALPEPPRPLLTADDPPIE